MWLGYNTNGFAHHRLDDALTIMAELGYGGVALTLDVHHLDPYSADFYREWDQLRNRLAELQLRCVIETGARFLLDSRRKHQPTLLSADSAGRTHRRDFLIRSIQLAADLNADAVSFWSGAPDDQAGDDVWMDRLVEACQSLAEIAELQNVRLAFEPEPGMFIDTMERFATLHAKVAHPAFGLTLDVGHLHCLGEGPIAEHIIRWQKQLWNVHIEDMRPGVHDHLMFGQGDMDFPPILDALQTIGYRGGVCVELSRHSHDAVRTAGQSLAFLLPRHSGSGS